MIDREAFVSRLILEADTELERGAAYWLQVDGLELARLRAIVRDLAACDPMQPYEDFWFNCAFCNAEGAYMREEVGPHEAGCPWLRATQEVQPLTPK